MRSKSRRAQAAEYEGRRLPHPDEAVYDQGLVFDLGTVVSRRRVLTMIGAGAGVASVGLLARGGGAFASTTPTTSGAALVRDPRGDRRPLSRRRIQRTRDPHPERDRPSRHHHELRRRHRRGRRRADHASS